MEQLTLRQLRLQMQILQIGGHGRAVIINLKWSSSHQFLLCQCECVKKGFIGILPKHQRPWCGRGAIARGNGTRARVRSRVEPVFAEPKCRLGLLVRTVPMVRANAQPNLKPNLAPRRPRWVIRGDELIRKEVGKVCGKDPRSAALNLCSV
jgi:hypothetical protein